MRALIAKCSYALGRPAGAMELLVYAWVIVFALAYLVWNICISL